LRAGAARGILHPRPIDAKAEQAFDPQAAGFEPDSISS